MGLMGIGGCASMLLEGDLRDVITPQVSRLRQLHEAALVGVCLSVDCRRLTV